MSTRKMRHSDVSLEDMMDVSDACVLEELNEMATVADVGVPYLYHFGIS